MKAKILIINPEFYVYGGAERQIVYLANWLTDHNYPTTLLTSGPIVSELRRDLKETRIIAASNKKEMFGIAGAIAKKFNIINPHNHPAELMTIPHKVPIVWQCNEPPIQILEGGDIPDVEKEAVRKYVTKALVISEFEKKRFKKIYGFEPTVNYPGLTPFPKFTRGWKKPKDRFGLKDNFVLIQAGMYTFTKNQLKTVEIFAEVKKKITNAKLILIGYDKLQYKKRVDEKITKLGLSNDVITLGYLKDDREMRDLYHMADVHVAPVKKHQGGWMTHFQALMVGKPAIISSSFTARKLAKKHSLGTVADIKDFTKEIIKIHDNYERRKDAAERAGKWLSENITWDKFCENYGRAFDELWEDKGEMGVYEY